MKIKKTDASPNQSDIQSSKEIIDDYYTWQQEEAELDIQKNTMSQLSQADQNTGERVGETEPAEELYQRLLDGLHKNKTRFIH